MVKVKMEMKMKVEMKMEVLYGWMDGTPHQTPPFFFGLQIVDFNPISKPPPLHFPATLTSLSPGVWAPPGIPTRDLSPAQKPNSLPRALFSLMRIIPRPLPPGPLVLTPDPCRAGGGGRESRCS